jgi:hypothetical protein
MPPLWLLVLHMQTDTTWSRRRWCCRCCPVVSGQQASLEAQPCPAPLSVGMLGDGDEIAASFDIFKASLRVNAVWSSWQAGTAGIVASACVSNCCASTAGSSRCALAILLRTDAFYVLRRSLPVLISQHASAVRPCPTSVAGALLGRSAGRQTCGAGMVVAG